MLLAFALRAHVAEAQLIPSAEPSAAAEYAATEAPPQVAARQRIVVGLPTMRPATGDQLLVAPNVNVTMQPDRERAPEQAVFQTGAFTPTVASPIFPPQSDAFISTQSPVPLGAEILPPEVSSVPPDASMPIFEEVISDARRPRYGGLRSWLRGRNMEAGVGRERLAHAPFELDSSQPLGNIRFRFASFNNTPFPDRSEYLWAKTNGGRGPGLAESNLDYQEFRTQLELGSKKFSTATEFPIRWTNPTNNRDHAGFGDMKLTVKTVIIDGDTVQVTQHFRSYFPTGSPSMGLGTGHVSLEPGVLGRYKWSDVTFLHGELKYFFPLGGDPMFSGQVLQYGVGMSHVLVDHDSWAILSTYEVPAAYMGNGLKTNPDGTISDAEGEHMFSMFTGLRFVRDCGGDIGLFEWGISGGLPVSSPRFYDGTIKLDLRWSY